MSGFNFRIHFSMSPFLFEGTPSSSCPLKAFFHEQVYQKYTQCVVQSSGTHTHTIHYNEKNWMYSDKQEESYQLSAGVQSKHKSTMNKQDKSDPFATQYIQNEHYPTDGKFWTIDLTSSDLVCQLAWSQHGNYSFINNASHYWTIIVLYAPFQSIYHYLLSFPAFALFLDVSE